MTVITVRRKRIIKVSVTYMYIYLKFRNDIKSAIKDITGEEIELEKPPKKEYGDLSSTIAFKLAKKLKKSPKEIAEELSKKLSEKLENIKVENINGFINFKLPEKIWINSTIQEILEKKEEYGKQDFGKGKKVIIEHTSANPNKPLHLGHFRNSCIGDTIARILRFLGFNVEVEYYVNDLGRQVAEAAYGWINLEKENMPSDVPFDWYLGEVYVKVHNLIQLSEEEISKLMKEMEEGKSEIAKKVKLMAKICLDCHLKLLEKFGIYFDVLIWESDIVKAKIFEKVTDWLINKGYLKKVTENDVVIKEGKPVSGKEYLNCYILQLSRFGMDDFVYLRSNGVPTYTAKDIAFALWKFGKIKGLLFDLYGKYSNGKEIYTTSENGKEMNFGNAEIVINVIGKEQTHAQNIVKYSLKLIGYEKESENYIHLAYGLVERKGIKLSGRKGTWKGFTVYEILEELKNKINEKVKDENLAEKIAISVLRYEMIKYEIKENIVIDENKLLDPSERGGIYLLYSYVRVLHILNKLGKFEIKKEIYDFIKNEEETKELIKKLSEFPYVLELAYRNLDPKILADYIFELCQLFNSWYTKYPVIKEEDENKKYARATVLYCLKIVMEIIFNLIGIIPVDRM